MKRLLLSLLVLFFFSCEDRSFNPENPDVEAFVQMVSEGEYKGSSVDSLPQFKSYDIPVLLQYSSDFSEIPYFPVSPVSSYHPETFTLGECLLWTIEAIRKSSPTAEKLSYPSLTPVLVAEGDSENMDRRLNEEELKAIYQLYEEWWAKKQDKSFQELQAINPLAGSGYRWR